MSEPTGTVPRQGVAALRGFGTGGDGDGQAICPEPQTTARAKWFGYEPRHNSDDTLSSHSSESDSTTATLPRIRLLLADDHAIFRQGLAALLSDFQDLEIVAQASDGSMALELARSTKPDVAILDLSMPKLSGIEVARRLSRELPDVRVIGLSMHEERDMAASMVRAGASTYLTKDGPSDSLIAAIRQLGRNRRSA